MSRDDGFAIADVDTGLLSDPKVLRLVRRARAEDAPVDIPATALLLYVSLVLSSWEAGERLAFDDGLPAWWIDDGLHYQTALTNAGLLDAEGRIPEASWESWFGPARDRRDAARTAGREGNRRRWHPGANGSPSGPDSGSDRVAIRSPSPSVPTVPTDRLSRARAREAKAAPRPLGDVLREMEL